MSKLENIIIWPTGTWMYEHQYRPQSHASYGNEHFLVQIDNSMSNDDLDVAVNNYCTTGDMDGFKLPANKVKDTLEFLADSDHVKVVLNPSGTIISEVYATKGMGYKEHLLADATKEQQLQIQAYVSGLNQQIKAFNNH